MAKTRVHELAKELGLNSKELLEKIVAMGVDAKSHMAALEDDDVKKIRNHFASKQSSKSTSSNGPETKTINDKKVIIVRKSDIENAQKAEEEKIQREKQNQLELAKKKEEEKEKARQAEEEKRKKQIEDNKKSENINRVDKTSKFDNEEKSNHNNKGINNYNHNNMSNNDKKVGYKDKNQFSKEDRNLKQEVKMEEKREEKAKFNNERKNFNDDRANMGSNKKGNNNKFDKSNNNGNKFDKNKSFDSRNNFKVAGQNKQQPAPVIRDLSKKEIKKYKKVKKEEEIVEEEIPIIVVPENMTVNEFASKIEKPTAEIIKNLMMMGIFANINQLINFETASKLAEQYEILLEKEEEKDTIEELQMEIEEEEGVEYEQRPPVVVVMGHVDHGKTSLLDAMRKTSVTDTEQGGITQHIGASVVEHNNKKITFLDTPGHEAFTAMRLRGAKVTDIAILVVAADDGVMPQTVEAIDHAKVAGIPVIVAVNKIDKPEANVERVKQELAGYGIVSEEWGGDNIFVEVSAKAHIGIENLLDTILLLAEMQELKARKQGLPKGAVIEARLDKNKGVIATLLVEQGTLNAGAPIFVGEASGNVRVMINDRGRRIKVAEPGTPVEITGLNKVPQAGDTFYGTADERQAREFAEKEAIKNRERKMLASHNVSLDSLFTQIKSGEVKKLNLIIKSDVQGSAEAVRQSLEKLSNEEVIVSVIRSAAGAITESDVNLAAASNAIIIGFNIRPQNAVIEAADRLDVDIKLYRVIYEAIEEVEAAMKGMLSKKYAEKVLGHAEVRSIFRASSVGTIAGCMVVDGAIAKNNKVRLLREDVIIFEGDMAGLKRFKDDVKEVKKGFDCGISLAGFNDIRENDVIEAYTMEEIKR